VVDVSVTGLSTVPPKPTASLADNVKAGRAEPHTRITHGSLIGFSSGTRKERKVRKLCPSDCTVVFREAYESFLGDRFYGLAPGLGLLPQPVDLVVGKRLW
jgi:hypothetical protein